MAFAFFGASALCGLSQELTQLTEMQLAREVRTAAINGDFKRLKECSQRLVQIAPRLFVGHLALSLILTHEDEYERAMASCRKAAELDPTEPQIEACMARVFYEFGYLDQALECSRKTLAMDARNDLATEVGVMVLFSRKQYESALETSGAVLRLIPLAEVRSKRILILLRMKRYDQALEEADQMIAQQPEKAANYLLRAKVHGLLGNLTKSQADAARAAELAPNHLEIIANSAWLYATNPVPGFCDGKKAVQLATRACEVVKWKNHELITYLAAAEAEAGLYEEAIKHQQEVVDWYMTNFPQHFRLPAVNKQLSFYRQHKPYRDLEEVD